MFTKVRDLPTHDHIKIIYIRASQKLAVVLRLADMLKIDGKIENELAPIFFCGIYYIVSVISSV